MLKLLGWAPIRAETKHCLTALRPFTNAFNVIFLFYFNQIRSLLEDPNKPAKPWQLGLCHTVRWDLLSCLFYLDKEV